MSGKKIGFLLGSMLAVIMLSSQFLTLAFAAEKPEGTQNNLEAASILIGTRKTALVVNGEASLLNVGLVDRSDFFPLETQYSQKHRFQQRNPDR